MKEKKDFNEYRFEGLNFRKASNHYLTMDRVSQDESKIVIKVADEHLIKTQYGYAFILDNTRVIFLKDWQVSENYFGNEVLLTKEYFNVRMWGTHENFSKNDNACNFEYWLEIAKAQKDYLEIDEDGNEISNPVKWENNARKAFQKMMYGC